MGRNQAPRSSGKESWRRMATGARYWAGKRELGGPGERGRWLAVVGGAGEGRGSHRALAGRQAEVRAKHHHTSGCRARPPAPSPCRPAPPVPEGSQFRLQRGAQVRPGRDWAGWGSRSRGSARRAPPAAIRVALATAGCSPSPLPSPHRPPPSERGVESPALGKCRAGRAGMRGPGRFGAARPALPAASGLAWAAGGGRAARRARGGKERSRARPTRLCLLCSRRWQRRGGRGGRRAQFSAPRSPGNSCDSARPTSGGWRSGGVASRGRGRPPRAQIPNPERPAPASARLSRGARPGGECGARGRAVGPRRRVPGVDGPGAAMPPGRGGPG